MFRRRLLIAALIASLWTVLVPLPSSAAPRFPATLERSLELARGQRLTPTRTKGAAAERMSLRLPMRANLVAMSFRTASRDEEAIEEGISIMTRFHTKNGWGSWGELHVEPEESPDPTTVEARRATNRIFTSPIWVGTADAMAFRVAAEAGAPAVHDLRAHVINSLGDSRPQNLFQRLLNNVSQFLRGGEAEALTSTPAIITRKRWGANESWRECCPKYAPSVQMAFVHHTVGTNSYSRSQSAAIVRSVYRYHTSNRGWSDIGYNFLVDRYGQIFEGRYGGMTRPVIGAHVKGFNTGSTGISLMGTFTSATPTSAMQNALKRLLAWKLDTHHVPPVGKVTMTSLGNPKFPRGKKVSFNRISGHRDGQQTACPGAKAYALLPSIRSGVNALGRPKIYLPSTTSSVLRPNGDAANENVRIRATFSETVSWWIELRSSGGALLRTFTGIGTSAAPLWDGRTADGVLADTGLVTYRITARGRGGVIARPADGSFYLVNKHPEGTILRTPTRTVVIDNGAARTIPSALVYNSWFRAVELVSTTDVEVDRYPAGLPLAMREGTLLAETDGTHAMISGGKLREFEAGVYEALGYTSGSALAITALEMTVLPPGPKITDATRHPEGAVVRASDGSVWTIGNGLRHRNGTTAVWRSRYRDAELVAPTALDIALPQGAQVTYRDGAVFRVSDGSLWIFADGVKRRFYDAGLYTAMGYPTGSLLAISTTEAKTIPDGPAIA